MILREEARRVLSEAGEGEGVGMNMVQAAYETQATTVLPDGTKIRQVALKNDPFNNYMSNYRAAEQQVQKSANSLPGGKNGEFGGKVFSGFYAFAKLGSKSPLASAIIGVKSANLTPPGKARAILAIFAGAKNLGDSWDKTGGSALGIDMQPSPTDAVVKSFDSPQSFVDQVISMASFDVAGETKRVLAKPEAKGQVTGVPGEMEVSAPTSPAKAGQPPVKDWGSYVAKTPKGGAEVKAAWEAYSKSAGAKPDFSAFAKWWSDRKKQNPSWVGDPAATVSYLKSMTRQGGALKVGDVSAPKAPPAG
jgi:hypothetical protein